MKKTMFVVLAITLLIAMMPMSALAESGTTVTSTIVLAPGETTTYTDKNFIVNSPLTLFELSGNNTKLVLNNCTITYTAGGTGGGSADSAKAIVIDNTEVYTGIGVELNDTDIIFEGLYSRGITFLGAAGGNITLNNSRIIFETADEENSTYSRGISVYQDAPADLTIDLNGSVISGCYYPLNFGSTPYGCTVNVNNSRIEGYCALNVWASNTVINVTNGSELIGRNYYNGSSSSYGVIVFSSSGTTNSLVNITDSDVIAIATGECWQWPVLTASTSVSVTLGSGTTVKYPAEMLAYNVAGEIYNPGEANPPITDSLAQFIAYDEYEDTEVSASVDPTYMIIIPAAVDFGTLVKDTGVQTQSFPVQATGLVIEDGYEINVVVSSEFVLNDMDGAGTLELPYVLYNGDTPPAAVATGGLFAAFDVDGTENGTIEVDTADITAAGSYKGTMNFTISYQAE